MINLQTCGASGANTGLQNCTEDFGRAEMLVLMPLDTEFSTLTDAKEFTNWESLLNAEPTNRILPTPKFFNLEDQGTDNVYEDGVSGKRAFVENGKYAALYTLEEISTWNSTQLQKLNGSNKGIAIITQDGKVIMRYVDEKIKPFTLEDFRFEKPTMPTGEAKLRNYLSVMLADTTEFAEYRAVFKPNFNPLRELRGIKDAAIEVGDSPTTSKINISVFGRGDGVKFVGLTEDNFLIYLASDATKTNEVDTVTQLSDGTYDLDFTTPLTAGEYVITLQNQPVSGTGVKFVEIAEDGSATVTLS